MAIIVQNSVCALCRGRLRDEPFLATSGVFLPREDPASGMCDAPIHWRCYAAWPERQRFARAYFDARRDEGNPYWGTAYEDDDVRVTVNPSRPYGAIDVCLAATGSGPRLALTEWNDWIAAGPSAEHELPLSALRAVWSRLQALGDLRALIERAKVVVPPEEQRRSDHYSAKVAWSRLLHGKVPCPACGARESDARFVDELASGGVSGCVCGACEHALTRDEILDVVEVILPVPPLEPRRRRG